MIVGRRRRARRRGMTLRRTATGVFTVAVVATLVLLGARGGYSAERPHLLAGAAWLSSSQLGELTLLDGSSAEVAAQVRVGARGDRIDVVQQGSTAYAINRTTGTIRRVDGATFLPGAPVKLIPDARDGLVAFAGAHAVVALDTARGLLASADPGTLAGRGGPVSLATRISPEAAKLDDAGRLWLLDPATGDLVWIQNGQHHVRRSVATPDASLLTFAGGDPVVVDTGRGTATVLDPRSGQTRHTVELDLRADDRIQVSGAPHAARLYVVTGRGVLAVCDLTASACNAALPLGTPGDDFGAAVETADRVFVPDYTSGRVWVVDLHGSQVVARPQVLSPGTRFQLLTRDGMVFFNDPDSEHAGVIRLDGGFTAVSKYETNAGTGGGAAGNGNPPNKKTPPAKTPPKNPGKNPPPNPRPNPNPQPNPNPNPDPNPSSPPPPSPHTLQVSVNNGSPLVGTDVTLQAVSSDTPGPTDAQWSFGDGQTGTGTTTTHHWDSAGSFTVTVQATFPDGLVAVATAQVTVGDAPPPPPHNLQVSVNNGSPLVGTDVTLQAVSSDTPGPTDAQWSFGDGQTGTGTTTTHHWDSAGSFTVTVQATFPDGRGAMATAQVTVGKPKFTLTISPPSGGTVSAGGTVCPSSCSVTVDSGTPVNLTATADAGFAFAGWGGACGGTTPSCTVVMNGNRAVSATFGNTQGGDNSGTLAPGATACSAPFFSDGSKSAHMSGNVTDGSGQNLTWTFTAQASGNSFSHSSSNFTSDFVPGLGSGNFPGTFVGCVRNDTGGPVAYTMFVGPGPF